MNSPSIKNHLKATLKLAIPIALSQLGQITFGIMDTAMVGHLGATAIGAASFVNNICNIPQVFILGVSSVVSVLVAEAFGSKNFKLCGKILNNSLVLLIAFTLIIIFGLDILRSHLSLFAQPNDVLEMSYGYYDVIVWSTLPYILYFTLKHYSEALSHPFVPLLFLLTGLFCNFIFNYALIFGAWGFPKWGLYGAGVSTLISRWILVLLLYGYVLRSKKYKTFNIPFKIFKPSINILKKVSRLGIPSGFQYLFEVAAFAGSGIMMGWIGTKELASHQITIQMASAIFMLSMGMSFAVGVRVGQLKGEGNLEGIRKTGIGAFIFIASLATLVGFFFIVFRNELPRLFISDPIVEQMTANLLIIVFLFQIFDSTQSVAISALRGLQDVRIPTAITFIAYWVIALPLGYFLAFKTDLHYIGIWSALGIGLFFSSFMLIYRFLRLSK